MISTSDEAEATPLKTLAVLAALMGATVLVAWVLTHLGEGAGERKQFRSARELVTTGNYSEAIGALETYLKEYPAGHYAGQSRFFIAKAHIGLGNLPAARAAFEQTIATYPRSLEAKKARYKLALLDLWEEKKDLARDRFLELATGPDGPLAPEAARMAEFLGATLPSPEEEERAPSGDGATTADP